MKRGGIFVHLNSALGTMSERLGRSSRVFFLGLLVACGIEVAVDWNTTLYEINVLRQALKQKGEDYVDILRRAARGPVAAGDRGALDELSRGLLEEEDVVYVRFTDERGAQLFDRLRASFGTEFSKKHKGAAFRAYYGRQIDRDVAGMLSDPALLKERIANSRHRDFVQAFTDAEDRLLARFGRTRDTREAPPQVLYQDRLYDDAHRPDRNLSYAVGVIARRGDAAPLGVVLVAFRHDRMNRAILGKVLKGFAVTAFFVCLILVQNMSARRAKLRLLDLEAALRSARAAIAGSLPQAPSYAGGAVGIAFAQSDRLGGTVYDVSSGDDGSFRFMLAVPAGAGVEVAFAAIVLRDCYRATPKSLVPAAQLERLLAAYDEAPLARPVELVLFEVKRDGRVRGVVAGLPPPLLLDGKAARPVELGRPLAVKSKRLVAAARAFECTLTEGALAIFDDGMEERALRLFSHAEAHALLVAGAARPQAAVDAVLAEARRRYKKRHSDDLFALLITRA